MGTANREVRLEAKKAYDKDACIAHRMRYANICLLSKLWYIAQIFPAPRTYIQRITAEITWYIWKGVVFKVPITTLQSPKGMEGWEVVCGQPWGDMASLVLGLQDGVGVT